MWCYWSVSRRPRLPTRRSLLYHLVSLKERISCVISPLVRYNRMKFLHFFKNNFTPISGLRSVKILSICKYTLNCSITIWIDGEWEDNHSLVMQRLATRREIWSRATLVEPEFLVVVIPPSGPSGGLTQWTSRDSAWSPTAVLQSRFSNCCTSSQNLNTCILANSMPHICWGSVTHAVKHVRSLDEWGKLMP